MGNQPGRVKMMLYVGSGTTIGAALGLLTGLMFLGNVPLGVVVGVVIGFLVGVMVDTLGRPRS